jgi:hypothetical protein
MLKARHCVILRNDTLSIDTDALHGTIVAASAASKRSTMLYKANDGHLSRVVWQLLYSMHAPLGKVQVPDCLGLGWARTEDGRIERAKLGHSVLRTFV